MTAMCGLSATLLTEYYVALVAPALFSFIVLDLACAQSRRLLLTGLLVNALCGVVCATYFWAPSGLKPLGFLIMVPAIAFTAFLTMKIYLAETGSSLTI